MLVSFLWGMGEDSKRVEGEAAMSLRLFEYQDWSLVQM